MSIFLADLPIDPSGAIIGGGFLALLAALAAVVLAYALFSYIFYGFAFMAIAKKAGQDMPGLSWIPGVGPLIIAFRASNMHWWPWLLILGGFIPFIGVICSLVFLVFIIIWNWKLFESIGKPGWWAILIWIPIVNFILIGIAAWSKK